MSKRFGKYAARIIPPIEIEFWFHVGESIFLMEIGGNSIKRKVDRIDQQDLCFREDAPVRLAA